MDGPSEKVVRKSRMEARSAARPVISVLELLRVDCVEKRGGDARMEGQQAYIRGGTG